MLKKIGLGLAFVAALSITGVSSMVVKSAVANEAKKEEKKDEKKAEKK